MVVVIGFTEFLETIGILALFTFIISSMIYMGLSFSLPQLVQPLKNVKRDVMSLVANFVLVPVVTLIVIMLLPLSEGITIGLLIIGFAAGGSFIPKLLEVSRGDFAYAIGLMIMLVVGTIVVLPIVLPLILKGVEVNPWSIAQSLIFLMLIPLILSMAFKYRYDRLSKAVRPFFYNASNYALLILLIAFFVVYYPTMAKLFGSHGIIAACVILTVAFIGSYFLGGHDGAVRRTLAITTTQRNLSAAFAVATLNFTNPETLSIILLYGFIGFAISVPVGAELGKLSERKAEERKDKLREEKRIEKEKALEEKIRIMPSPEEIAAINAKKIVKEAKKEAQEIITNAEKQRAKRLKQPTKEELEEIEASEIVKEAKKEAKNIIKKAEDEKR